MDDNFPDDVLGSEYQQDLLNFKSVEDLKNLLMMHNIDVESYPEPQVNDTTVDSCKAMYANETHRVAELNPGGYCEGLFDSVTCWPPTPLNATAVVKCFEELGGIKYDQNSNATKECFYNGSWARANYDSCKPILDDNEMPEIMVSSTIYLVGYSVSLVALIVATTIFLYYKDLKCLRNRIHTNLMCAYCGLYLTWILTHLLGTDYHNNFFGILLMVVLPYFNLTTFFWMFVEGLYLYILVVRTLKRENFKFRYYVCIGWGTPFLLIVAWVITKVTLIVNSEDRKETFGHVWVRSHWSDWFHEGPTAVVLMLNLLFLIAIMYVIVTKLKSANNAEAKQYRKAAKALFVLMPLLGITYVVTIAAPTTLLSIIRSVLLSVQGLMVALIYCFLNTEVQNTLKHHFETWKTSRTLGQRRLRSGSKSKDWSPRSRTESIRSTEWTLVSMDDTWLAEEKRRLGVAT